QPRIIETQYGRGYRFIAAVHTAATDDPEQADASPGTVAAVGRESELAVLDGWLQQALGRKRQVGFVVGEAGLGKTTLVAEFLTRLRARQSPNIRTGSVLVAYGQCHEHYSTSEPYLPIIEALSQLCSTEDGASFLSLLRRLAPSWLGLLPALASDPGQGTAPVPATPQPIRPQPPAPAPP